MYDVILFDLDGTLTDSGLGITNAVKYALGKEGITVNDRSELFCFIGPPLVESFQKFYGFSPEELADENENLPVEYDPKCAWAVKHMHLFPVEINRADLSSLLRVPGIGVRSANRIIAARRHTNLQFEHLKKCALF